MTHTPASGPLGPFTVPPMSAPPTFWACAKGLAMSAPARNAADKEERNRKRARMLFLPKEEPQDAFSERCRQLQKVLRRVILRCWYKAPVVTRRILSEICHALPAIHCPPVYIRDRVVVPGRGAASSSTDRSLAFGFASERRILRGGPATHRPLFRTGGGC